ncbi:hypothetical protein Q0M87_14035, partial [Staphylococcus aureus]|nr:hypothetical protein [Staphylococcus aureus]
AKSGIFKPKIYAAIINHDEPVDYNQVVKDKNWRNAMKEEYNALIKNNTWELFHPPHNKNIVSYKWTFKLKKNPDGSTNRFKARLVAKG